MSIKAILTLSLFISISWTCVILYLILFYIPVHYNLPSILYALEIIEKGHLVQSTDVDWQKYWGPTVRVETLYPIPALIHTLLIIVTGIPLELSARIPLLALLSIVSYALARTLLDAVKGLTYRLKTFYSAIYFMYFLFIHMPILYTGRAHSGIIFLVYLIYTMLVCFIRNLGSRGLILVVLMSLLLSYTYYTATFAAMFMSFTLLIMLTFIKNIQYSKRSQVAYLTKMFLLSFLSMALSFFILNPFILKTASKMGLNFEIYIRSLLEMISQTKITQKVEAYVTVSIQHYDSQIFWKRVAQSVKLVAIISVPATLILYMCKNSYKKRVSEAIPLYAMMIISISLGEKLFYRVLSVRFEPVLGFILLIILFNYSVSILSRKHGQLDKLFRVVFCFWIVLGCLGMFVENIKYRGVEPSMRMYIDCFAEFIVHYVDYPLRFYTDMASASEIAFLVQANKRPSLIDTIPYIDKRIVVSLNEGNITLLKRICEANDISAILYYKSETPLRIMGAEFGAGHKVKLNDNVLNYTNKLFSSGKVMFLLLLS